MENEQKKIGIYRIYCKANGKSYYGQTNDYDRRMIEHKKLLRHSSKAKHHCTYLQNAWNLYGEEQFEFSLVEECPEQLLTEREQWYFDTYGPQNLLFNIALCAEATRRGIKLSEETKQKLREANLGPKSPMWGKKMPEEAKRKIGLANSGANHWHYGRPCTEEEKLKNSLSLRGENCHLSKLTWEQVRQARTDFISHSKTAIEISEQLHIEKTSIYSILKNQTWKDDSYDPVEANKILEQSNKIVNRDIVLQIREEYKTNKFEHEELASKYGLSISALGKITRNETWQDPEYAKWMADNIKPQKKPTRINFQVAQQIREDFEKIYGVLGKEKTYIELGKKYNLASITVRKIIKNKLWSNEKI